jgi:hypothetical protein
MGAVGCEDGRADPAGRQGDQEIEVTPPQPPWIQGVASRQAAEELPGLEPHAS